MGTNEKMHDEELKFLRHIKNMVTYWEGQDCNTEEKLNGLAFSILSTLDGGASDLPEYILSPINDDETPTNIAGSLHEKYYSISYK